MISERPKHLYLISALLTATLAFATINIGTSLAADIPIEGYVEGGLTIELNGDWGSSMTFEIIKRISGYEQDVTTSWEGTESTDYITFVDDTDTAGFYITMTLTDFVYDGPDQTQADLSATAFDLYGQYSNGTPSAITKGYDDSSYNLSILPDSCESATTSAFTFHSNFYNSGENYALTGSNSAQTLLQTSVDCLSIGHIRFDRAEFFVSSEEALGTYTGTLTLTIIDGTP